MDMGNVARRFGLIIDHRRRINSSEVQNSSRERYIFLKRVGNGSFGTVITGYDDNKKNYVAIKVSKREMIARREIEFLKFLDAQDNPKRRYIIGYKDSFFHNKSWYLVLEMIDCDLDRLIMKQLIPKKEIRRILRSIAEGLEFLHDNGIIHGDLKPSNIGVKCGKKMKYKILDFGMSFLTEETEEIIGVFQSPAYRAPEIYLQGPFDNKVDIWGLGCIAGELERGWLVFDGMDDVRQMRMYVEHLGIPPKYILENCKRANLFFDMNNSVTVVKNIEGLTECVPNSRRLEDTIGKYDDPHFIDFLKGCIAMDPEDRKPASELLAHPWIELLFRNRNQRKCHNFFKNNCVP